MRKLDPVKHDRKRRQILAAAARVFDRDGLRGASISRICAEAKISPGHLYHYFASKEDLIAAVVELGYDHVSARLTRVLGDADVVSGLISAIEEEPEVGLSHSLMFDMLADAGRNPAIADILRKAAARMETFLADVLEKAQARGQIDPKLDAKQAAQALLSLVDGARGLLLRRPDLDKTGVSAHMRLLMERFLAAPERCPNAGGQGPAGGASQ